MGEYDDLIAALNNCLNGKDCPPDCAYYSNGGCNHDNLVKDALDRIIKLSETNTRLICENARLHDELMFYEGHYWRTI